MSAPVATRRPPRKIWTVADLHRKRPAAGKGGKEEGPPPGKANGRRGRK